MRNRNMKKSRETIHIPYAGVSLIRFKGSSMMLSQPRLSGTPSDLGSHLNINKMILLRGVAPTVIRACHQLNCDSEA
jgi:hypothetical protein